MLQLAALPASHCLVQKDNATREKYLLKACHAGVPQACTDLLLGTGVCVENVFGGVAGGALGLVLGQYDCPGSQFKCVPCGIPGSKPLKGCPGT